MSGMLSMLEEALVTYSGCKMKLHHIIDNCVMSCKKVLLVLRYVTIFIVVFQFLTGIMAVK